MVSTHFGAKCRTCKTAGRRSARSALRNELKNFFVDGKSPPALPTVQRFKDICRNGVNGVVDLQTKPFCSGLFYGAGYEAPLAETNVYVSRRKLAASCNAPRGYAARVTMLAAAL